MIDLRSVLFFFFIRSPMRSVSTLTETRQLLLAWSITSLSPPRSMCNGPALTLSSNLGSSVSPPRRNICTARSPMLPVCPRVSFKSNLTSLQIWLGTKLVSCCPLWTRKQTTLSHPPTRSCIGGSSAHIRSGQVGDVSILVFLRAHAVDLLTNLTLRAALNQATRNRLRNSLNGVFNMFYVTGGTNGSVCNLSPPPWAIHSFSLTLILRKGQRSTTSLQNSCIPSGQTSKNTCALHVATV